MCSENIKQQKNKTSMIGQGHCCLHKFTKDIAVCLHTIWRGSMIEAVTWREFLSGRCCLHLLGPRPAHRTWMRRGLNLPKHWYSASTYQYSAFWLLSRNIDVPVPRHIRLGSIGEHLLFLSPTILTSPYWLLDWVHPGSEHKSDGCLLFSSYFNPIIKWIEQHPGLDGF